MAAERVVLRAGVRGIISFPGDYGSAVKEIPTLRCCSQSSFVTSVTTVVRAGRLEVREQEQESGEEGRLLTHLFPVLAESPCGHARLVRTSLRAP